MATWSQLLADIRTDIKDTGTTKRFGDAVIFLYAKDAIKDYSQYFPRRMYRVALTLLNGLYTLPADFVGGEDVECPEDAFLEKRYERPGVRYLNPSRPTRYHIESGGLKLNAVPQDGDPVLLTYDALHPVPATVDAVFTMTIPDADEELIRLYVKAKTSEQLRTNQANLDRFKQGSGKRDDNPLEPEVRNLMWDYRDKIAERFPGGIVNLYRLGRLR